MKINITEEEKRNILKMHKSLMSEQAQTQPVSVTTQTETGQIDCRNLDTQMGKEYTSLFGADAGKIEKFQIIEQPDYTKSKFGVYTYELDRFKSLHKITVTCGSKNAYSQVMVKNLKSPAEKEFAMNMSKQQKQFQSLVSSYCEKINRCQQQSQSQS